jgi:hypothetical protein
MIGFITVCSLTDSRILIIITTLICLLIGVTKENEAVAAAPTLYGKVEFS